MMRELRVHAEYAKLRFASRMTYRFDFFITMFTMAIFQFIGPFIAMVIYGAGGTFPGWSLGEVLVLQGLLALVHGIAYTLFISMVWSTSSHVRNGTLDILLLKPVHITWHVVMDAFDEEDLGQIIGGVLVLLIGRSMTGPFQGSVLITALLVLVGVAFYFSLCLLVAAGNVYFVQTGRLYEFIDLVNIFGSYPRTVYQGAVGMAFTALIPLLIIGHYPASALLGLPLDGVLVACAAVVVLLAVSYAVWRAALRRYGSAGG